MPKRVNNHQTEKPIKQPQRLRVKLPASAARSVLAAGVLLTGALFPDSNARAQTITPQVLYHFSLEAATGAESEEPGLAPHLPPVYNPLDGKLYGVTPTGGLGGIYSVNYSFTPAPEITDYQGQSNPFAVILGFHTGLAIDSRGIVFGGANPLSQAGLLFQWPAGEAPRNAFPDTDTSGYGNAFDLRGLPAVDDEDNLYFGGGSGRTGMALFQRSAGGELTLLVDFAREDYVRGSGSSAIYTKGQYPAAVIFSAADQALYGITVQTQSGGAGDPAAVPEGDKAAGTLFRVNKTDFTTDGNTAIALLYTFAEARDGIILGSDSGQHSLLEDGDWLYGTSSKTLWRLNKNDPGTFTHLHTFGTQAGDGETPHGPLVLAADGNIYGTTRLGGAGNGSLFRIVTGSADDREDDSYEQLYQFDITNGAEPVGLSVGPYAEAVQTLYGATRGGGAAGLGTLFSLSLEIPPGELTLGSDKSTLVLGESATLTWSGTRVDFCVGEGDWSGAKAASGAETLTPQSTGEFTYTLSCQDNAGAVVSASTRLTVEPVPSLSLTLAAATITLGESVILSWSGAAVGGCGARGGWSGDKTSAGSETLTPDTAGEITYSLTCLDSRGNSLEASATLVVESAPATGGDSGGSSGGGAGLWLLPLFGALALRRRPAARA